jgi:TATA-binding protein-associated factor Taf7
MSKEPNLVDNDVYLTHLREADALGKAYVHALNEQRKRQQERQVVQVKDTSDADIQYLRVKLSKTTNPKIRSKLTAQIKLMEDAAEIVASSV